MTRENRSAGRSGRRPGADRRLRRDATVFAVLLIIYLAAGSLVQNSYYQLMLTLVLIWATAALSWNLFSGYSGLSSFGHAAFIGVGAYTVVMGMTYLALTPWLGIPLGAVLGALAAVLIGIPTFRLRGHYFALAMLCYPIVILYVMQFLGFQEMPLPMHQAEPAVWLQFSDGRFNVLVAAGLLVIAMALSMLVENSRFGLSLMAVKQNELAAEAAGLNAWRLKLAAIAISGAIAAAAGGLYACVLLVVTPESVFGMLTSAQPLVITLFGGAGTYWGPLIGAAVLVPLSEMLQGYLGNIVPGIQGVVYGVAIILVMLMTPEGIFWKLRDRYWRQRHQSPAPLAELVTAYPAPAVRQHAAQASGPLLQVEALSRTFGGLAAVKDVSLSVAPHRILGIIGPNGAGKTTLFNLMNGILSPDRGTVTLAGEKLDGRPLWQIARAGVGRTFQTVRSFPRLAVLDNVIVGAYGAGLSGVAAIGAAFAALERTGLGSCAATEAASLTNKQLRLMELARALAGNPRILLLDETLAGLSREECDDVLAVLKRLREDGFTIVIIEHTMYAMLKVVDEFLVLDHGEVLAGGSPQDVIADRRVVEAYLGRKWAKKYSR
ncbi:MAG: ABC transporter permease subunit [Acetobacteraceae bacterium]